MEGLYDISFVSWGSTAAPNRNMSTYDQTVFINTSDHGSCRVWVVGYPWAVTTVPSSANGGMTREMLLQNILGWLDDSLTYSGGGGAGGGDAQAGAFSDYVGNPEIIQMMVGNWEAGGFHKQTVSMTWDGTAGNYPDQNANPGYDVNVYRTTDPGGSTNYVVTGSPNNDWVNGNDVDFQFPWYAYIVDVGQDGIQIDVGNNVDDTVFFSGLLLADPDNTWSRLDPTVYYHWNEKPLNPGENVPSCVIDGFDPPVYVAGYYLCVDENGDSGDEVRAYYGAEPASVTVDNNNEITVECVAHWPVSLVYGGFEFPEGSGFNLPVSDPQLYWSMYPGQNMLVPGTSDEIPQDIPEAWDVYRYMFDIDPSMPRATRDAGDIWNRPQFAYSDSVNSGRVVTFNYRSATRWNPDLNRDGSHDDMDKFPVRVRLFTDHEDYLKWDTGWPDHLQDAGLDPGTGGPVWDPEDPGYNVPDYLEGGAYIIDEGEPVYPLKIDDDPNEPDPKDMVAGSTNDYDVTFSYVIQFGQGPYTIDLQMGFDYNDIGPGETELDAFGASGETDYAVDTWPGLGSHSSVMDCTDLPDGDYYAAIRVTDNLGDQDVFIWPDMVTLAPGYLLLELCDGYTNWNDAATGDNAWTRGNTGGGATTRWYVGSQFPTSATGDWEGPMFHLNNGADGSNGNSGYAWPGAYYWYLVSRAINVPSGATPDFWYQVRVEGNDYYSFLYFYGGWTTSSSTTSTSFNGYLNTSPSSSNYVSSIPAYVYYENTVNTMASVPCGGQTIYIKFLMKGSTYYWSGTGARGAHLDGIYLSTPPPAPNLPFADNFEDSTLDKWDVTIQAWSSNSWVNRTPSLPGTYPPISGTRVAGYSYQPASLDYNTPNFGTTMKIDQNGRQCPTGQGGTWTVSYYADGYIETFYDDLDVYRRVNGSLVGSWNFDGDLGGSQRSANVTLADGDTFQLEFYYHGDIWMYYGPQIDDVDVS